MFRILILSLTLFTASITSLNSSAEIYRWVDEHGKTQFSDRPVRGKTTNTIEVDTTKNSYGGGEVLNRQRDLLERYEDQDQQSEKDQQQAKLDKENEEKLKSRCLRAKDKLARYERGLLYTLDDQGERVYFSEEKRERKIEEYRQTINENCK